MNVIRNWYIKSLGKRLRQYGTYFVRKKRFCVVYLRKEEVLTEHETYFRFARSSSGELPKIKKKLLKKISCKHKKHTHHITGLRYEDLFNESEPAVAMAIARLSPKEREERDKRLRRALDLDFKKTTLPEEVRTLLLRVTYRTSTHSHHADSSCSGTVQANVVASH